MPARRRERRTGTLPAATLSDDVAMSIGTPFHARTSAANRHQRWREWSGYLSATTYADAPDIEYAAIRDAAALIDVSPLFKYRVSGPDALDLVDRVITRDATRLATGRVFYTPWCDEAGKVVDDGTVARLDDGSVRWTAAEPRLRWLTMNAGELDVVIEDVSDEVAAVALQGPLSRAVLDAAVNASDRERIDALRWFRRTGASIAGIPIDISRTGYTGDLGYELWVDAARAADLWNALAAAGAPFAVRPAGLDALDIVRLEAGLILLDVDYTSARAARTPDQAYSPYELDLGHLVDLDAGPFVGRTALRAEVAAGGPPRRLVGLVLTWDAIERRSLERGLPPAVPATVSREPVPVFGPGGGQVGRVTSCGWSPIRKQVIALASVPARLSRPGTTLGVEWTVEGSRGRVPAVVVDPPFLDLARRRA